MPFFNKLEIVFIGKLLWYRGNKTLLLLENKFMVVTVMQSYITLHHTSLLLIIFLQLQPVSVML